MRTSQCAVYQVKETPEYRDVRFRSYEKLRSEGKSVSIENYQQVYIGRIQPGETPADIKTRLQKQHKMTLDAIKHQGQRTDLTSSQVGMKLQAMDIVGQEAGDRKSVV